MLEAFKTLISGVLEVAKSYKGDWNENDSSSPNYVKNRTHWAGVENVSVLPSTTLNSMEFVLSSPLVEGITYTVIFNGTEYKCVAKNYDGYIMIGNNAVYDYDGGDQTDTGEPFAFECNEGNKEAWGYFADTVTEAPTISITCETEVVHKLDKKYIDMPEGIVTEDDLARVAYTGSFYDLDVQPTIYEDVVRYASQSLTTSQKTQARDNIGAGTSNFSGSYEDLQYKPCGIETTRTAFATHSITVNGTGHSAGIKTGYISYSGAMPTVGKMYEVVMKRQASSTKPSEEVYSFRAVAYSPEGQSNYVYLGNPWLANYTLENTGEPIVVRYYASSQAYVAVDSSKIQTSGAVFDYYIVNEIIEGTINTLDERLLPYNYAKQGEVYTKEEVYPVVDKSTTITWDGITTDRDTFKASSKYVFYKVSEPLCSAADSTIQGTDITINGTLTTFDYVGEGIKIVSGVAIVDAAGTYKVYYDPSIPNKYANSVVPSPGIYFIGNSSNYVKSAVFNGEGRGLPEDIMGVVRTVNDIAPDDNGNVTLEVSVDGFATEEYVNNAVSGLASTEYVDGKIDALVGEGASTTLDTIGEISKAIEAHQDVTDALNSAIGTKANASDLTAHTGNTSNPHGVTKAQVGLGNVENKSSATIRGEITSGNVTDALGYSPVKTVNNIEPDENGNVQIEIQEGFSGEWDDLKNRPFGEGMITVIEPLDVTWDGNIEGLEVAYGNIQNGTYACYRVSDFAPHYSIMERCGTFKMYSESKNKTYNFDFTSLTVTAIDECADFIQASGFYFVFAYTDTDYRSAGIYVNKGQGTYICSITTTEPIEITKMGIKTIDPKYLPETSSGAGANVYVQDTEPTDAEEGALWVDTANEPAIMDQDLPVVTAADNGKVLMVVNGQYQLVDLALSADANGVLSV